jgi:DNA-binding beta-propeller fold protein YncE
LLFFLASSPLEAQDDTSLSALRATDLFRLGLESYNRFAFNEAILSFEQALSYRPGEARILDWLGRSYYRSGLEDIALRQWGTALTAYGPASPEAILLGAKIEMVRNRRGLVFDIAGNERFVESGHYPGLVDDISIFKQPSALLANDDGTIWVVAYASNELVKIDVNGVVRDRKRGSLSSGFDRPYDIARASDGRIYVSEFRAGRISILSPEGNFQQFLGSKGLAAGQLVAPSNLAVDEDDYLYAIDYGNPSVSKWNPSGEFIMRFAQKSSVFPGLISPTGIAAINGLVYICDNVRRAIYIFDSNGRFLDTLNAEGLNSPEGLRVYNRRNSAPTLLSADKNRLLAIDTASSVVREVGVAGNNNVRLVGLAGDRNGNILGANFDGNEIAVLTSIDDISSGLFVQIDRVESSRFPEVTLEVSVSDRSRRPIVGLDARNFVLSENGNRAANETFLGASYRSGNFDVSVLVERSRNSASKRDDISTALSDIAAAVREAGGNIASLVSAGVEPVKERFDITNARSLEAAAKNGAYSDAWRFDMGIRLAASDLLPLSKKRAVLFVGSGLLGELAFDTYGLSELASYMANNAITFYTIALDNGPIDAGLQYLCAETGGRLLRLYRTEGIAPVIRAIPDTPSGTYILRYTSALPTNFDSAFLPIEAEVYLLERSGRDTVGYFAPYE